MASLPRPTTAIFMLVLIGFLVKALRHLPAPMLAPDFGALALVGF
jgi:hypothetical protein